MTASFPAGFKCSPMLREMYPECEREMMPHMRFKARRLRSVAPYLDEEDAIQEGRLALLSAMIRYDMNKCGGSLKRYAGFVLDNCYRDMFYKVLAQVRMPRGLVRDMDGEWRLTPVAPMSLDEMLEMDREPDGDWMDPEEAACRSALESEAQRFKMKMMNSLKGRVKAVFECKMHPSTSLLKMCDNMGIELGGGEQGVEIPNYAIANYLDLTKNQVDWCVHKIKGVFTKLAKDVDFSELFGHLAEGKGWPMIHAKAGCAHDLDFQRRVIASRKLDPQPKAGWDKEHDHFQKGEGHSRWIERYDWGMVMVLRRTEECVTLVIEGERINTNTGAVFGSDGLREDINEYVTWYRDVVKHLKESQ